MLKLKRGKHEICCPQCGHHVPLSERCGSCGVRLRKWKRESIVRFIIFFLIMGVLFAAQYQICRSDAPCIRIENISPLMNFSTVRVEGELDCDARLLRSGSAYYLINDGTGILAAFDKSSSAEKLWRAGTRVVLEGSLHIGAGHDRRMNVESLEVLDAVAAPKTSGGLAGVTRELDGESIRVVGRVLHSWAPRNHSKAPYKIVLKDAGAELDVVHWLPDAPDVTEGDSVEVSGMVCLYEGRVQIKVLKADDIRIARSVNYSER